MLRTISKKINCSLFNLKKPKFYISVYQGISPSLLATMSLSQGISGKNNQQLIDSLAKNNIIKNKSLLEALKKLDRRHFIQSQNTKINCYENKPYKISGGQNMTDIFTHAVILQEVCQSLDVLMKNNQSKQGLKILDIGTGHGYLALAISTYLNKILAVNNKFNRQYKIIGIDSNNAAIQFSKILKTNLMNYINEHRFENIQFHAQSIQQRLAKNQSYDIIIGGFYMPPNLNEMLIEKLQKSHISFRRPTFGIWPTQSSSGQSLYRFNYNRSNQNKQGYLMSRTQLMSTMFSMPTVKTNVSKYFVQQGEQESSRNQQGSDVGNQQQLYQNLKTLKIQRKKQQKDKLKQQLKIMVDKHGKKLNKKLSLNEMKTIPQINNILDKLSKI